MANGNSSVVNVNDLVDYYSRPESASGAPAGMVYDAEVGDFVSPQKAAARDAIRAQRANLAMDRAVYGESPGYMSMTMRDDKGPYAYMGDMSPYTRPPDTYGQPVAPQTMGERALAEAQAGAERALYAGMGAITGGLVGEATARNIKNVYGAVSSEDLQSKAKQVKDMIERYGALSPQKTPDGINHIRGPAYDVVGEPVVFKTNPPKGPEHTLSKLYPDIMVQSVPIKYNTSLGTGVGLVSEKVVPLNELPLTELNKVLKNNFRPQAAEAIFSLAKQDRAMGLDGALVGVELGEALRLRTAGPQEISKILLGPSGVRTGVSRRTAAENTASVELLKRLAGDPLFDRIADVTRKESMMPEDALKRKLLNLKVKLNLLVTP